MESLKDYTPEMENIDKEPLVPFKTLKILKYLLQDLGLREGTEVSRAALFDILVNAETHNTLEGAKIDIATIHRDAINPLIRLGILEDITEEDNLYRKQKLRFTGGHELKTIKAQMPRTREIVSFDLPTEYFNKETD